MSYSFIQHHCLARRWSLVPCKVQLNAHSVILELKKKTHFVDVLLEGLVCTNTYACTFILMGLFTSKGKHVLKSLQSCSLHFPATDCFSFNSGRGVGWVVGNLLGWFSSLLLRSCFDFRQSISFLKNTTYGRFVGLWGKFLLIALTTGCCECLQLPIIQASTS